LCENERKVVLDIQKEEEEEKEERARQGEDPKTLC
jgi:hypothetical protein